MNHVDPDGQLIFLLLVPAAPYIAAGVYALGLGICTAIVIHDTTETINSIKYTKSKDKENSNSNDRLKGKPGDVNVSKDKETKIGKDGLAEEERHHSDHGNPKHHSNPHDHDITWENGQPKFGPARNYPNGAPPFK